MRNLIKNLFRKNPPKVIQKPGGLPQELVEEIVSYIYDVNSLCSCSMTCRSLYIATLPRLHYSLGAFVVRGDLWRSHWPQPLERSHELNLLPLVRRFSIRYGAHRFGPKQLGWKNLRRFSQFYNLRELIIHRLELTKFVPNIRRYFNRFVQTLRSLTLHRPRGSTRQILYFIGHFPNLQDLELDNLSPTEKATAADSALVPPSIPPLSGWLSFRSIWSNGMDGFLDEMTALYGGLHFRHVFLDGTTWRQGLGACAGTLETLQLYEGSLSDHYALYIYAHAVSRCKSLKTLRIINSPYPLGNNLDNLKTILPNISSLSLDLVFIYSWWYFSQVCPPGCEGHTGWSAVETDDECGSCVQKLSDRFKILDEIQKVRPFSLGLHVDVHGSMAESAMKKMERDVKAHRDGEFGHLLSKPIISTIPRKPKASYL